MDKQLFQLDDDPVQIAMLKQVCKNNINMKHQGFEDCKSFLTTLKHQRPDICVIDLNLKEGAGAGFTVIQAIRNKYSTDLPIIVISGRETQADIDKALKVGANDFLTKPFDLFDLSEKIGSLLKK